MRFHWRGFYYNGAPFESVGMSSPHHLYPDSPRRLETILWLKMIYNCCPTMSPNGRIFSNVRQDISLKMNALEHLRESRLQVDNARTDPDRLKALALYDQAIRNFQQITGSDKKVVTDPTEPHEVLGR
jgi:hypothetical protein